MALSEDFVGMNAAPSRDSARSCLLFYGVLAQLVRPWQKAGGSRAFEVHCRCSRREVAPVFLGRWSALIVGCCLAFNADLAAQKSGSVVAADEAGPRAADLIVKPQSSRQILRDGKYLLQQGDEITIKVFAVPELDETVRIGPDNKISVLLLSDAEAGGLTVEELQTKLTARYSEYYREPQVSVIVRLFANLKVYVGGEVERPGLVPIVGHVTALGAVLQSGGFTPKARTDNVILIRNDGGERAIMSTLNVSDVLHKGKPDVPLKPFDVIYVPMSKIARIDRFIDQYLRKVLPLTATGGFTYLLGNTAVIPLK